MKHFLLVLIFAALAGCAAGSDPRVSCPGPDQELTRAQWEACYGHQDKDASGGR